VRAGEAIWRAVIDEQKANKDRRDRSFFTATHPDPEERMKKLAEAAANLPQGGTTGADAYHAAMRPHRAAWLDGELARGEYDESLVVINRLVAVEPQSGELMFFQGEAYRRRANDGDLQLARDCYQRAIQAAVPFPAAYRGLGLVAMKMGDKPAARQAFTTYLERAPTADDRAMIQFYLQSL
jgi:tetratricopeptide (TPR) repeat protein